MKQIWMIALLGLFALVGCRAPQPTRPAATSTPLPLLTPPPPPTPEPAPWPVITANLELGLAFDAALYPQPIALDPAAGRIYVSGQPSQTIILDQNFNEIGRLAVGGNLACDPAQQRLFIGTAAGLNVYNTKSGSLLAQISLARTESISDEVLLPAVPVAVASGNVYAIQNGLYRVNATGLYATAFPNLPRDIRRLAVDEEHGALYASINNGIPGSNNRNDLWLIDLRTRQAQPIVAGIQDIAVQANRQLIVTLGGRLPPGAVQIWGGQPFTITRQLDNLGGLAAVDEAHNRLYILSQVRPSRLMALDLNTLTVRADVALPDVYTALAMDKKADRLYLLTAYGDLLVINGHGGAPPTYPRAALTPPKQPVNWLRVSPNLQTIYGSWGGAAPRGGTLLASHDSGATWHSLLPDSSVTDLAPATDQILFAATERGIYQSTDGGLSWEPRCAGLRDVWITRLALSPAFAREPVLFALTKTGSLHRSTDGGQTWVALTDRYSTSPGEPVYALALSPDYEHDRTVFMSTGRNGGQWLISTDAGESWSEIMGSIVHQAQPSPSLAADRMIFGVFDQAGLMRSTDGGYTWSGILRGIANASGQDVFALAPTFETDQTALLLVRNTGQLYRTTDRGESWHTSTSPLAAQAVTLAWAHQTVWLGTGTGRVVSAHVDDLEWTQATVTLTGRLEAIALSPNFEQDGTIFVAGQASGVWLSPDQGQTWRDTGFPAREAGAGHMHLAISPAFAADRTIFAATGTQLYRSTDGGQSWRVLPIGPGNMFPLNALAISPEYARDHTLLLAGDYRAPTVLRSTDGGDNWLLDATGLPTTGGLNQLAISPNFAADQGVYVWADANGLYRSGDGGIHWTRVYQPAGSWLIQSFGLSPDFGRDRLMFLGTLKENHNVYRSADGGASWHPAELGLPLELLWASAVAISPNFGRDRTLFLGTDRGIYRSSDGGQMWRQVADLPEVVDLALTPTATGEYTLLAISASAGLYISTDGGARWQAAQP